MKTFLLDPFINYFGQRWWAPAEFGRIEAFVNRGDRVLDIGSGGGWTGELLKEKKGATVTLLDVQDFNQTKLPLLLYDGKRMPFEDDSFDTALLLFVLHHCEYPVRALKETMRVSKRVIILEDTFRNRFERIVACANDTITNLPSFFVSKEGMNLPFHFRKTSEWKRVFKELQMKLIYTKQKQFFHMPLQKTLFVLERE